MSNYSFTYDYKQKERKNGNSYTSIRDIGENALLEVEKNGNTVVIFINWMNEKTCKFTLPLELLEKMYKDLSQNNVT